MVPIVAANATSSTTTRPCSLSARGRARGDAKYSCGICTLHHTTFRPYFGQRIVTDQNFLGANGQFDRARFEQIIRQAGFTETRYVNEQRNVLLRRQIAQSISGDLRVPTAMLTAINQFQNGSFTR